MTKKELIKAVADKAGFTQKDTEVSINAMLDVITSSLKKGEEVSLVGFGKFTAVERAARDVKNNFTGEMVHVDAKKAPKFSASSALKTAVNA